MPAALALADMPDSGTLNNDMFTTVCLRSGPSARYVLKPENRYLRFPYRFLIFGSPHFPHPPSHTTHTLSKSFLPFLNILHLHTLHFAILKPSFLLFPDNQIQTLKHS